MIRNLNETTPVKTGDLSNSKHTTFSDRRKTHGESETITDVHFT